MSEAYETRFLKVEKTTYEKLKKLAEKRHIKVKLEAPWATLARGILREAVEAAEGAQ